MEFAAFVKNVSANVGKGEISFSFVMRMDDTNMERAKELAFYIGKSEMVLNVGTRQMSFTSVLPTQTDSALARADVLLAKRGLSANSNALSEEDQEYIRQNGVEEFIKTHKSKAKEMLQVDRDKDVERGWAEASPDVGFSSRLNDQAKDE